MQNINPPLTSACCPQCGASREISEERCPSCNAKGLYVKNLTVRHLVEERFLEKVGEEDYYLCMNPECDVAYYNNVAVFLKDHLKVPIWFKRDANPKYVCYCSKVKEDDVIKAVLQGDASTIEDICRITGAMSKYECEVNNPTGNCCYNIIKEVLERALVLRNSK
ncbi:MAG: copper chaperone Copz family protein [Synergistetes bacterium]|nr:MAG: BFD domain protein (2Fe-2S)-binding domain protein [bacterium 42_11]MBC7332395.1 copper chaperone Copz family protein [Synergistota bacterium]MDK2872134.1 hypothetical protein [bacterium]